MFEVDLLNAKEDAAVTMVSVENARTTAFLEPIVTKELAHVNMMFVPVRMIASMGNAAWTMNVGGQPAPNLSAAQIQYVAMSVVHAHPKLSAMSSDSARVVY